MAERREAAHAFAQGELERRHRRELSAQPEDFDRFVPRAIDDLVAFAETILEGHRCRRCRGGKSRIHMRRVMRKLCRSRARHLKQFFVAHGWLVTERACGRRIPSSCFWQRAPAAPGLGLTWSR